MVCFSFLIIGSLEVIIVIPCIPEMIERMQVEHNIVQGENQNVDA